MRWPQESGVRGQGLGDRGQGLGDREVWRASSSLDLEFGVPGFWFRVSGYRFQVPRSPLQPITLPHASLVLKTGTGNTFTSCPPWTPVLSSAPREGGWRRWMATFPIVHKSTLISTNLICETHSPPHYQSRPQHLHSSTPTHIQQQSAQLSEMFFIFCKKFSISTAKYTMTLNSAAVAVLFYVNPICAHDEINLLISL